MGIISRFPGGGGGGVTPFPHSVTNVSITSVDNTATLTWINPAASTGWDKIKIVYKAGSAPTNPTDGVVLDCGTTDHSVTGKAIAGLADATTYYFVVMAMDGDAVNFDYDCMVNKTIAWVYPSVVTDFAAASGNTELTLSWTIPTDAVSVKITASNDVTAAAVYSGGGTSNTVTGLTNGTAYTYYIWTLNSYGRYSTTSASVSGTPREAFRYGFKIDKNDSNPATRVSYLYDAVGLTPAQMNFGTGIFDYGDWGDFVAVSGNYPVMLKSDGTEDYKLDPNDYTKREDGVTASDVANTSYDGNAMSAFPRLWVNRYEDTDYRYCIFSNVQYDSSYRADAFINHDGNCMDKFYMPCFKGSLVSNKLRSIKGLPPSNTTTAAQEVAYAEANNSSGTSLWSIIPWSRRAYLNDLLVLIGKSTNTQAVFGKGSVEVGETAAALCATGTLSDKGQFWGSLTSGQKSQVKVFHCEGVWGDRWERIIGLVNDGGAIKVKMSPPYSLTGFTDYSDAGITLSGTSGGYISSTKMSALGNIPATAGGSGSGSSAYEADAVWFNNTVAIPILGCSCYYGFAEQLSGAFALNASLAASNSNWGFGASPSCDMPSEGE